MSGHQVRDLDRVLATSTRTGEAEIDDLAATAADLARALAVPLPNHTRDRALFIEGAAAKSRSPWASLAVPGLAVVVALAAFAVLMGRGALPGDSLYPVRKVLHSAGLASSPLPEAQRLVDEARLLVERAESAFERSSTETEGLAVAALMKLGAAEAYLLELDPDERGSLAGQIDLLGERAVLLIRLGDERPPANEGDNSGPDNFGSVSSNSGSGSGNSGPGSDDSAGDHSAVGSDDETELAEADEPDGDNSGSGSDSSGPGSGDSADELEERNDDLEGERDDLRNEEDGSEIELDD